MRTWSLWKFSEVLRRVLMDVILIKFSFVASSSQIALYLDTWCKQDFISQTFEKVWIQTIITKSFLQHLKSHESFSFCGFRSMCYVFHNFTRVIQKVCGKIQLSDRFMLVLKFWNLCKAFSQYALSMNFLKTPCTYLSCMKLCYYL